MKRSVRICQTFLGVQIFQQTEQLSRPSAFGAVSHNRISLLPSAGLRSTCPRPSPPSPGAPSPAAPLSYARSPASLSSYALSVCGEIPPGLEEM